MPRKTSVHKLVTVSGAATDQVIQAAWGPAVVPGSSAPTGKVRVLKLVIQGAATPGTVQINSKGSGAGTAILAPITSSATVPIELTAPDDGAVCVTNPGEALTVTVAGATGTTTINVDYDYQPGF